MKTHSILFHTFCYFKVLLGSTCCANIFLVVMADFYIDFVDCIITDFQSLFSESPREALNIVSGDYLLFLRCQL